MYFMSNTIILVPNLATCHFVLHTHEYIQANNHDTDYGAQPLTMTIKSSSFRRKAKEILYHLATDTNFRPLIDMRFNFSRTILANCKAAAEILE